MKVILLLVSLLVGVGTLQAQYRVSLSPFAHAQPVSHAQNDVKQSLHAADKWFASDKVKHFSVSCLLVIAGKIGSKEVLNFDRAASSTSAVGSALLIGFVKEVIDDLNPNNIFSLKDLAADLLGIALAISLLSLTAY
jgi:uncharacterized protein YfiM (DUF2279 family)